MKALQEGISLFIEKTSTPIKKLHSDNIEKYLDKFIKFPGSLSIVSIFFISSDLVHNYTIALLGVVLIITSLLIALNVLRLSVDVDHSFYEYIVNLEKPMVIFSRKFTQFNRGEVEEKELEESYEKLQKAYTNNAKNADKESDRGKALTFEKKSINLSFYVLLIGIILCFISAIKYC